VRYVKQNLMKTIGEERDIDVLNRLKLQHVCLAPPQQRV
jgi:hypothetical protein